MSIAGTFYPSIHDQLEAEDVWLTHHDWVYDETAEDPVDLLIELARHGNSDALDELRREVGPVSVDELFEVA